MSSAQDAPFSPPGPLLSLVDTYPAPDLVRAAARNTSTPEREHIVRLWLSEGIPYAFRECPALYEVFRAWLAECLKVDPKEVSMIGSARVGYSLRPGHEWGRPFSASSDLDLCVICPGLFEGLVQEFMVFSKDLKEGRIHARGAYEATMWASNIRVVPGGIRRGVIHPRKIPTWHRYPLAQNVGAVLWTFKARLAATSQAPRVRSASLRVYRDWRAFTQIVAYNLGQAASEPRNGSPTQLAAGK